MAFLFLKSIFIFKKDLSVSFLVLTGICSLIDELLLLV